MDGPDLRRAGALREASVFVLSSRGKAFPLAPMEAMASGIPCAAFNMAPGIREIIDNGKDGFLARPGNIGELSSRLTEPLSSCLARVKWAGQRVW